MLCSAVAYKTGDRDVNDLAQKTGTAPRWALSSAPPRHKQLPPGRIEDNDVFGPPTQALSSINAPIMNQHAYHIIIGVSGLVGLLRITAATCPESCPTIAAAFDRVMGRFAAELAHATDGEVHSITKIEEAEVELKAALARQSQAPPRTAFQAPGRLQHRAAPGGLG